MQILFVSTLASRETLNYIYETSRIKPTYSAQKFHRLIVEGLVGNGANVTALSALPISPANNSKKWWNRKQDTEDAVIYKYIPFLNIKGIRQIFLFCYSFFYTLKWGIGSSKKKKIIYDALNVSICIGSLLASKIARVKSVGVLTDMPGLMVGNKSAVGNIAVSINKIYFKLFDYYVFLTEQMNTVVNIKSRKYIIMEGLVDIKMKDLLPVHKNSTIKNIIYAGGLYEEYGIKMLLDAFIQINMPDVSLSLYGNGPMQQEIRDKYQMMDRRIHYYGVVPNDIIVKEELKATLLINPRPTNAEFTKFSFPSKNMEYMVSGTPVLTTRLPGMPEEYYPFIYAFDEESVNGYKNKLYEILNKPASELWQKGFEAQQFVLIKKNNFVQAGRILELIKD